MSTFEFWLELAWRGANCKGKTLLVNEIFFTLHRYCTVTVQYWCSVSKAKHDWVFSAALLNGRKIQISLQLQDRDFTWRVASTAHWTLSIGKYWQFAPTSYFMNLVRTPIASLVWPTQINIKKWHNIDFYIYFPMDIFWVLQPFRKIK